MSKVAATFSGCATLSIVETTTEFLPMLSDTQYLALLIGIPATVLAIAFRLMSSDRVLARLAKRRESGGAWLRGQIDWHVHWNLWGSRICPVVAIISAVVFLVDTLVRLAS